MTTKIENFTLFCCHRIIVACFLIQDSLRLSIFRCGFQILGHGLEKRPDSRFSRDSEFLGQNSRFQIPGLWISQAVFFTTNVRKTSCYLSEQNFSMGEWLFTALKCCLYWSPVIYFLEDYQKLHRKNSLLSDAVDCLAVFVDMCSWNPQCKRSFT